MFAQEVYRSRRKKLLEMLSGQGIILLPGNDDSPMNYAKNLYPYRQDSTFLYFTGIDLPGMTLLIDTGSGDEILYGYDPTIDDIIWTGPQASLSALAEQSGIPYAIAAEGPGGKLLQAKTAGREIHFIPPYQAQSSIRLLSWLGIHPEELKKHGSEKLIRAIFSLRAYKSEIETGEIEKAVDITADMHIAAMNCTIAGMNESDVVAEIVRTREAAGVLPSFPPIVTIHGEILHTHHHHHTLRDGNLLLVDCGAESKSHYAGDMTRTFPVGREFTQKQKEIYETVLSAQVQASGNLKPGVPYRDLHLLAAKVIVTKLGEIGLMRGNPEEAVAAGAHALFFQHGLGHMMGLDVHDMENFGEDFVGYGDEFKRSTQFGTAYLRLARKLETGFVLTVEPGIYFIPDLINQWKAAKKHPEFINYDRVEKYRDFGGIRIEEDFLITESGSRRLGNPVPKSVKDIEELRARQLQAPKTASSQ